MTRALREGRDPRCTGRPAGSGRRSTLRSHMPSTSTAARVRCTSASGTAVPDRRRAPPDRRIAAKSSRSHAVGSLPCPAAPDDGEDGAAPRTGYQAHNRSMIGNGVAEPDVGQCRSGADPHGPPAHPATAPGSSGLSGSRGRCPGHRCHGTPAGWLTEAAGRRFIRSKSASGRCSTRFATSASATWNESHHPGPAAVRAGGPEAARPIVGRPCVTTRRGCPDDQLAPQHVAAADDADQPAVLDDRHPRCPFPGAHTDDDGADALGLVGRGPGHRGRGPRLPDPDGLSAAREASATRVAVAGVRVAASVRPRSIPPANSDSPAARPFWPYDLGAALLEGRSKLDPQL